MKQSVALLFAGIAGLACFLYSCNKEETPTVGTTPITQITGTSILTGGDITSDGGLAVISRGVCWSTSPNPKVSDEHSADGSGTGSFLSTISGLTPETTYYIRAYATNAVGTSYGQEMIYKNSWGQSGTFIDLRDNTQYKWVRIGNQIWMAENLSYIPEVVGPGTGSYTTQTFYVYGYNGTNVAEAKATTNYNTYGVLYNWPAACESCPDGWHLASVTEWTQLIDYLGGENVAGGKLKESGTILWKTPNTGATNESGFTALPAGNRYHDGSFLYIRSDGYWWSATEYNENPSTAYHLSMFNTYNSINKFSRNKQQGLSVRCLRD